VRTSLSDVASITPIANAASRYSSCNHITKKSYDFYARAEIGLIYFDFHDQYASTVFNLNGLDNTMDTLHQLIFVQSTCLNSNEAGSFPTRGLVKFGSISKLRRL
jgi:hypothetical protein